MYGMRIVPCPSIWSVACIVYRIVPCPSIWSVAYLCHAAQHSVSHSAPPCGPDCCASPACRHASPSDPVPSCLSPCLLACPHATHASPMPPPCLPHASPLAVRGPLGRYNITQHSSHVSVTRADRGSTGKGKQPCDSCKHPHATLCSPMQPYAAGSR